MTTHAQGIHQGPFRLLLAGMLLLVLVTGCRHPRDASRSALAEIDAALDAATPLATQFAATELEQAQRRVSNLHRAFEERVYSRILFDAPALVDELRELEAIARSTRDAQQQSEWNELLEAVPAMQLRVREWVDRYRRRNRASLPNINRLEQDLAQVSSSWGSASNDFSRRGLNADLSNARAIATQTLILVNRTISVETQKP